MPSRFWYIWNSEYRAGYYKYLKISIRALMKNSEMLKFILGYFKTKKMCNYAVKKLFFAVRYVPDKCEIKKNV